MGTELMDNPVVVYDSCVLYPAPLRDLLIHLALTGLFQAKWTEEIHHEWIRSVLKNRPDLRLEQLQRTREAMNTAVRDCLVEGYESHIDKLSLPDEDDRHVLAAAIHSGASIIVTFNLTDFPKAVLAPFKVRAQHPDEFVCQLIDLDAKLVVSAAERQRLTLRRPPKSQEEFLQTLLEQGLKSTVSALQKLLTESKT